MKKNSIDINYMKKILVTGASGYIGKHVIQYFLDNYPNYHIIALSRHIENYETNNITYIQYDILKNAKSETLYEDLKKPDICIHLAWQNGFEHNNTSHLDNLSSHYYFIQNLLNHSCSNINILGTMHEIGYYEGEVNENTPCNPLSLYGISKNALRQACFSLLKNNKNISLKWLRAFYITGDDTSNNSIFSRIIQWEKENILSFPFTDGKNKYDFIDVKRLAEQICQASIQVKYNGIINTCSGYSISLKNKVEEFLSDNEFKIRPNYGAFPNREYDSPEIWGNNQIIKEIVTTHEKENS